MEEQGGNHGWKTGKEHETAAGLSIYFGKEGGFATKPVADET